MIQLSEVIKFLSNLPKDTRVDNFSIEETSKGILKVDLVLDNEGRS